MGLTNTYLPGVENANVGNDHCRLRPVYDSAAAGRAWAAPLREG